MRRVLLTAATCAAVACSKGGSPGSGGGPDAGPPPSELYPTGRPSGYANPIPAENALPGDPGWRVTRGDGAPSDGKRFAHVEAYADRVSANAGDTVQILASVDPDSGKQSSTYSASWALYRIGWYGGAGARKLTEGTTTVSTQIACPIDAATGMVRCSWTPTFSVTIPPNAVSGLFLVRILRSDGWGTYVPLVVKDDRMSDLYLQASVTTYQAYNTWSGESLYVSRAVTIPGNKATVVSFDRPYISGNGSGQMLNYEAHMAAFLERHGYDVSYTSNLDVVRGGANALRRHGAFLSVGHDEYWDGRERDAVEGARDAGTHVFFLGANSAYWKVRLSDPGVDGNARIMTCYKSYPQKDPLYKTPDQTGLFRGTDIGRDEEELVGTTYEEQVLFGHPWVVDDISSPVYEGTGLQPSDALPGLVGYEYDIQIAHDTPGAATSAARSPVVDVYGRPGYASSVSYRAPSGALVFSAGSIYFAWGVDDTLFIYARHGVHDQRVERMVANLFKASLGLPIPQPLQPPPPPPPPPNVNPAWASSVSNVAPSLVGQPSSVAPLPDGSFVYADPRHHRIRRVAAGQDQPYAGDGTESVDPRYDNLPGLQARFFMPSSIWADAAGNVYVADTYNNSIRMIANDAAHTVTTIAGQLGAQPGLVDATGKDARFFYPMGLAYAKAENRLLVADLQNGAIRAVDLATRGVKTIVGTAGGGDVDGPSVDSDPSKVARIYMPTALAAADDGRIFVAMSAAEVSMKIKSVSPPDANGVRTVVSLTSTGVGYSDGTGLSAQLRAQGGLAWDGAALLFSDPGSLRIRRLVPGNDASSTVVQTWAGSGQSGLVAGSAAQASFGLPLGLWRQPDGTVYVADGTGAIRAVR